MLIFGIPSLNIFLLSGTFPGNSSYFGSPKHWFLFPSSCMIAAFFLDSASLHFLLERGLPRRKSEWMCSFPHAFLFSGEFYPVFSCCPMPENNCLHRFFSCIVVDDIVLSWPELKMQIDFFSLWRTILLIFTFQVFIYILISYHIW